MLRRIVRLAALVLVAAMAYLAVTFAQVWRASKRDEARRAQAVLVFGAAQYNGRPSPVLRARLDHAAALYKRGYADTVVVTGGRRPGDRFTEASVSADYLIKAGVPDSAVLREVSGRTSWQSLASSAAFLKQRGITRVILVSDGFHALRVRAMADELGLTAYTSPSTASPIRGMAKLPYLVKETAAVAAGRVLGFRRVSGIDRRVRHVGAANLSHAHSGVV
ncbi:MAG TPA: YdcF family protein [Acidimicrobiales bacterium]|nr:YdcF family protein [Acidimicrobiales bacterium]